jgi:hypothetical protein
LRAIAGLFADLGILINQNQPPRPAWMARIDDQPPVLVEARVGNFLAKFAAKPASAFIPWRAGMSNPATRYNPSEKQPPDQED